MRADRYRITVESGAPRTNKSPMDSVTQAALGAAVGEATLGRRVGNKAPLWGEILGRAGYLCHPSVYVLGLRVGYAAYW